MSEQGAVIWFTGVPASGKSTIAAAVQKRMQQAGLPVENLDADEVRQNLSPNLGFTAEARDENTKRLAWMAKMLSKHGVNVLIAAVAPLRYHRERAREWCPRFVEVWTTCSLDECKKRDPKGLYARADRGEINDIAGWHMPYEEPEDAQVVCRTQEMGVGQCAEAVVVKLSELGYMGADVVGGDEGYSEEDQAKVEARLKDLGYM